LCEIWVNLWITGWHSSSFFFEGSYVPPTKFFTYEMFSTFLTLLTYWFTTQLQLSNRKCLSMHLLQSNGKSLKWRYNLSCGNRDYKTSFVSEEAFGNNKYAILPSKLPIRSEHNNNTLRTFQYLHYLGRCDTNIIIIISEMLKIFKKHIFKF
jgi:hypothetical protein